VISAKLVDALRERKASTAGDELDLVFASSNGSPLNQGNLRRRVLQPAAEEACLWSGFGFHAFGHTCASLLFDEGRNVRQVAALARPPLRRVHAGYVRAPAAR
jgi:integrase